MLSKKYKPDIVSEGTEPYKEKNTPGLTVVPSGTNQSTPVALTALLSDFKNTCPAKTPTGAKIALGATKIYDADALDKEEICSITESVGTDLYDNAMVSIIKPLCSLVEETLVPNFGNGDYQKAIDTVKSFQKDAQTIRALNALETCKTNDSKRNMVLSTMNEFQYGIYSVGSFTFNGVRCIGYISSTEKLGSELAYTLVGTGNCPIKSVLMENTFHPIKNPSGVNQE